MSSIVRPPKLARHAFLLHFVFHVCYYIIRYLLQCATVRSVAHNAHFYRKHARARQNHRPNLNDNRKKACFSYHQCIYVLRFTPATVIYGGQQQNIQFKSRISHSS